ncbi:SGNH/GDSL hydrolase family protein [Nitrospira sp. Nam80]
MESVRKLADAVFITAASSCLLFLVVMLLRHGWAWHYVVLILLAVIGFAALRLSVSTKLNLALLLLSTAVGAYGAEALVGHVLFSSSRFSMGDWLNFPSDRDSRAAVRRIKEEQSSHTAFDARTRLQVVQDLRNEGIRAFPDVFSAVLFQSAGKGVIRSVFTSDQGELLPLASLSNVTTVFCNESGEYIIYESDEHGFHNPHGIWQTRPIQIAALGDSFTHGACVPSDESFVAGIRSRLPATINLGINGDGPLAMLATLKEYAASLRPKVVLWFYFEGNDLRDLDGREKYSPLLRTYLEPSFSQRLIERQAEVDRLLTTYLDQVMQSQDSSFNVEEFLKLQRLRNSVKSMLDRPVGRDGLSGELIEFLQTNAEPAAQEDLELFRGILREARTTVSTWGGQLYFIYLPAWQRYRIPELASHDRDIVINMVSDLDIPLVDLHTSFAEHPDPLSLFPSRRHAHYNIEGHRLVAQEVLKRLAADDERLASNDPLR